MGNKGYTKIPSFGDDLGESCCRVCTDGPPETQIHLVLECMRGGLPRKKFWDSLKGEFPHQFPRINEFFQNLGVQEQCWFLCGGLPLSFRERIRQHQRLSSQATEEVARFISLCGCELAASLWRDRCSVLGELRRPPLPLGSGYPTLGHAGHVG